MQYLITLALAQVLITIYLLWEDFKNKKAERYLLLYILILGTYLVTKFIYIEFYESTEKYIKFSTPLGLAGGPLLYFYVKSKLKETISKTTQLIHLIPFAIFLVFFIISILVIYFKEDHSLFNIYSQTKGLVAFVSVSGYCIYLLFHLGKNKKNKKNYGGLGFPFG